MLERGKKIHRFNWALLCLLSGVIVTACGPQEAPAPDLPNYLQVPTSLMGYSGSGLVTLKGGRLSLRVAGAEQLNTARRTYTGVGGSIVGNTVRIYFTDGQPLPYRDRSQVPAEYWSYGEVSIYGGDGVGKYPMGGQSTPSPRGEIADLTLNLPGPQLYVANTGSLTITRSTLVRSEGSLALYRLEGTFGVSMYADGTGIPSGERNPAMDGSFDVLLVKN